MLGFGQFDILDIESLEKLIETHIDLTQTTWLYQLSILNKILASGLDLPVTVDYEPLISWKFNTSGPLFNWIDPVSEFHPRGRLVLNSLENSGRDLF